MDMKSFFKIYIFQGQTDVDLKKIVMGLDFLKIYILQGHGIKKTISKDVD